VKISWNWLGRHVDLSGLSPEGVAEELTRKTAEVEGVEAFGEAYAALRVGEVLECAPHPNADRLRFARVALEKGIVLPIVCGAPNVEKGQRVAVAPPGARLPGGLAVERAKIRGVESHGMILSERELAIGDDHEGILVLGSECAVGASLAEALGLQDAVLEIDNKSLTHRPDLWGHYGFAREIAAIFERDLAAPPGRLATFPGGSVPVEIAAPDLCPLYLALPFDADGGARSPLWLRALLLAVGQRPLGAVVDLTNYVMFDVGEPTHAFDRTRLSGDRIGVRRAREGERLRTLDGADRALGTADLVIADGERAVAVAGVMGGEASEVTAKTRRFVLECAAFEATSVRLTAQRLGVRTEASSRFEKSLDPAFAEQAASLFVALLPEVCTGSKVTGPASIAGAWKPARKTIRLRGERARERLGAPIPTGEIASALRRLRFEVESEGDDLRVGVPTWRATKDVTIEEDLLEEAARMIGYDRLPQAVPVFPTTPPPQDPLRLLARRVADFLAGAAGFHEAYGYSFLADETVARLGLEGEAYTRLRNPISKDLARIRREILPSLLAHLPKNATEFEDVRLFEVGKGYRPEEANERGEPREVFEAAAVWAAPVRDPDEPFARAKGAAEALLRRLTVEDLRWIPASGPIRPYLHPVRAVRIDAGEIPLGFAGELDPGVRRGLGLPHPVSVLSFDLGGLLRAAGSRRFERVPRFPAVRVDVALALPEEISAARGEETIRRAAGSLFAGCEVFDVFRGEALGEGRKSLAYHVTLRSPDRTLDEKDTATLLDALAREIAAVGGELRRA